MDSSKLLRLNSFINRAYECLSFMEFLKLAIMELHQFVMYDSGMFFCGISRDCSFFKPYTKGPVENYYRKQDFPGREAYLEQSAAGSAGTEAYVYKAVDYSHGIVQVSDEPRRGFLVSQEDFHIVCMRIINKGQFMGEIYLHRSKDKSDFDDEDMFVLRLLQPHISTIFAIIHVIAAAKQLETGNDIYSQKGLCMFDGDLSLAGSNITGIEMLKMPTVFGSSLLYHIKEICTDLLGDKTEKNNQNAVFHSQSVKTPRGEVKIRVYSESGIKPAGSKQFIVVTEFCNGQQSIAEYKFKFSKRESEIIDGLIQGKSNSSIAKALGLSENTLKTHIKNIYKKTGANNRTELTYLLMLNQ